MLKVTITRSGNLFTADCPSFPGSPPVGRAKHPTQALGEWLAFNAERIYEPHGIKIELDEGTEQFYKKSAETKIGLHR